jgi:hypothetical protein
MCDADCDDCGGYWKFEGFTGAENDLAHEVADGFFLLYVEALQLGGRDCEFVEEVVVVGLVVGVEEAAGVVVLGDADCCFGLEEELAGLGLIVHGY